MCFTPLEGESMRIEMEQLTGAINRTPLLSGWPIIPLPLSPYLLFFSCALFRGSRATASNYNSIQFPFFNVVGLFSYYKWTGSYSLGVHVNTFGCVCKYTKPDLVVIT